MTRHSDKTNPINLWTSRILAVVLFSAAAVLAGYTTWALRTNRVANAIDSLHGSVKRITMNAGLSLQEVLVQGRHRTRAGEILNILDIERGMPIFSVDIHEARKKLDSLPWVRRARVERRLPGMLYIHLQERIPLALWQKNGNFKPVDAYGVALDAPVNGLGHLPVVVGGKAPDHTPGLITVLKTQPHMFKRVKGAVFVGKRRWDVLLDRLEDGITVHLPEKNTKAAWARLARLDQRHGLLKRQLSMVDLRMPDRLIVRLDEETRPLQTAGQDT